MQIDNKKLSKRNTYLEKLLEELGKVEDWEYAGKKGDRFSKTMKEHYSFVRPPYSSYCACGHFIITNCYVRNLNNNEIKVVGNCCIQKWKIEKKCGTCNTKHHRWKYTICSSCEKEAREEKKRKEYEEKEEKEKEAREEKKRKDLLIIGNEIISFGKHINKTIKFIYENDIRYAKWCFDKYNTTPCDNMYYISNYYQKIMNITIRMLDNRTAELPEDDEDDDEESEEEKLLKIGNKIFSSGKYKNKNKTIKFIYENDIRYAKWCFNKFDIDNNSTLKFRDISYYYEHMSDDDDENDDDDDENDDDDDENDDDDEDDEDEDEDDEDDDDDDEDKIYLEVPFCEKEEAKNLGAMWDVEFKKWYIFNGDINKELILQKWKTWQKNCVENKYIFPGRLLDKKIIETITHKVYLEVPFCEKEDAKKLGAMWDSEFKKWYIFNENINKDLILQKWNVTIPDDQLLI
jgi:hypothetical protein